jgi:transcriptional antiterminator RfaH
MNVFRSGWYVIYTKPRHEKKVLAHLAEREIKSFLPTKKTLRTWHDRKKYVEEPLFPSYVFIYLNDVQNFYNGVDTEGALNYVRNGKEIARVRDAIVDDIRLITTQSTGIEVSSEKFVPGRQMVIQEGPLTGLSCEVVQSGNGKKLLVRVDLLNRSILVSVLKDQLLTI